MSRSSSHPVTLLGRLRPLLGELVRYGATGLTLNALLFAAYLGLVALGLPPLAAACITYWTGLPLSYVAHGRITFARDGGTNARSIFVATHLSGWLLNMVGLHALVNVLGLPHGPSQAAMVLVVAAWLFTVGKLAVFTGPRRVRG